MSVTIFTGGPNGLLSLPAGRKIAIDSHGRQYALFLSGVNQVAVYRSTDGGLTWVTTGFPASGGVGGHACAYPALVITPDDRVHVVWSRDNSSYVYKLTYARYDGTTWTTPVDIYSRADFAAICTDYSGNLYAVGAYKTPGIGTYTGAVVLVTSTDGGVTWSAGSLVATEAAAGCEGPALAVDASGRLFCAYERVTGLTPSPEYGYIMTQRSVDGGATWTDVNALSVDAAKDHRNVTLLADAGGRVHAVWNAADGSNAAPQIQYSRSTDSGVTWSTQATLTSRGSYPQAMPTLGQNTAGTLVLMWTGTDPSHAQAALWDRTSTDGGATWAAAAVIQTPGGTDNEYTPSLAVTQVGARLAYVWAAGPSGGPYSVLTEALVYNQAPNAPVLATRSGFDATTPVRFSWTFSDGDPSDTQSAYQLQIKRVDTGAVVVDTGKVAGTSAFYDLAASTLGNNLAFQWRVATWDNHDAGGPYAGWGSFNTAAQPTTVITTPATDGSIVSSTALTVAWTFSSPGGVGQSAYQVVLKHGTTTDHDSGKTAGTTTRRYTLPAVLVNGTTYTLLITTWDANDVASPAATRTFVAVFTPSPTPWLAVYPDSDGGVIRLVAEAPDASASQSTVVALDLYRKASNETAYTRIAAGIRRDTLSTFTRAGSAVTDAGVTVPAGVARYAAGVSGQAIRINRGGAVPVGGDPAGTHTATTSASAIAGSTPCTGVLVQSDPGNAQYVYVGDSGSQTIQVPPGGFFNVPVANANQVYVKTLSSTALVNWIAASGIANPETLTLPAAGVLSAAGPWTLEVWGKNDRYGANGADTRVLAACWPMFYVALDGIDRPTLSWLSADGLTQYTVQGAALADPTIWHHYALAWTGGIASLYVDGLLSVSAATTFPHGLGATVEIGSLSGAYQWDGLLDSARASAVARTAAELVAAAARPDPAVDRYTVLVYTFDGGYRASFPVVDYTPAHRVTYTYFAHATAASTATADSATATGRVLLDGLWLHDPADPAGTLYNFLWDNLERSEQREYESTALEFDGRTRPVVEFSGREIRKVHCGLHLPVMPSPSGPITPDKDALEALAARRAILCYRDRRGRKVFGPLQVIGISDENANAATSVDVLAVDFAEGV